MYKRYLVVLFVFLVVLYLPSFTNFFSGDDWYHLRVSNIHTLSEFFNFFSFVKTEQSISFYRPISTQVFFFLLHKITGLNPVFYHLVVFSFFLGSLFLIYELIKEVYKNEKLAFLTVFFYSISVTNFTRVYFLSAFQEILMVFFILLSLFFALRYKSKWISLGFFVLALMSKETAIVYPLILGGLYLFKKRKELFSVLVGAGLILIPFLILRVFVFGFASGDSYTWDFSPIKALNTLFWYIIWSFGAPEFLVDYTGSGLRLLPRYFEVTSPFSVLLIVLILGSSLLALILFVFNKGKKDLILPGGIFVLGILPVIFLPWHKFTLELGLSLFGFALGLSLIVSSSKKVLSKGFVLVFILLNLLSYYFTYQSHYSVTRAKIAKRVFNYFEQNYPDLESRNILFVNGLKSDSTWGVSNQIAQSTSKADMFKIIYGKKTEVFFEDDSGLPSNQENSVIVNSIQFLK